MKRKKKRSIEQHKSEETSSKISKNDSPSENSDDEDERTLERLVFGGENDAIRELEKDLVEDQDRFYTSSDEVRNSVKTHRSVVVASLMCFRFQWKGFDNLCPNKHCVDIYFYTMHIIKS